MFNYFKFNYANNYNKPESAKLRSNRQNLNYNQILTSNNESETMILKF